MVGTEAEIKNSTQKTTEIVIGDPDNWDQQYRIKANDLGLEKFDDKQAALLHGFLGSVPMGGGDVSLAQITTLEEARDHALTWAESKGINKGKLERVLNKIINRISGRLRKAQMH